MKVYSKYMHDIKACVLLIALFLSIPVFSQKAEAASDLRRINEEMKKHTEISFDMLYQFYNEHSGGNLIEEEKGSYKRSGNTTWTKIDRTEIFSNDKISLTVDNGKKVMIASPPSMAKFNALPVSPDSLVKYCSVVKSSENEITRTWKLTFPEEGYMSVQSFEFTLNKSTFMIENLSFCFIQGTGSFGLGDEVIKQTDHPRLVIMYKNFNFSPGFSPESISEAKYVVKKGNEWKPAPAYASYNFVDRFYKGESTDKEGDKKEKKKTKK